MQHITCKKTALAAALAMTTLLAACGGGGGGSAATSSGTSTSSTSSTSTTASSQPTVTGTQSTPTYATGSAQLAMFTAINTYRQECGFPALQQNTILDQAAQNHASYMAQNGGTVTDEEVQGNPGFTGVTGQDRANALGWPSSVYAAAADAGYSGSATTPSAVGQQIVYSWAAGVYHQAAVIGPEALAGYGITSITITSNGTQYPFYLAGTEIGQAVDQIAPSGAPLTFPCQGATGMPYAEYGESPMPPNANTPFGTPVTVEGNLSDVIVLQSGMMTAPNGTVINLNVLNSSNDPNKLLGAYEAVAYPTSPLTANTQYSVTLTGTINGAAFSRNFSFTTGNVVG